MASWFTPMAGSLLFTGGAVYTPDATGRRLVPAGGAEASKSGGAAVAVRGGRVVAVGAHGDRDVRDAAGPGCEVVDLNGRALLPGFQDAHAHPAFAGLTMVRCNLIGAQSLDEALARIARYIAGHPDAEWIAGSGWRMEWFASGTPSRQLLDQHTGGRPAFLVNRDVHGAWANTRALELAGIGPGTPDPPDGRIEREADGGPQGTLHEGAATLVGLARPGGQPGGKGAGAAAGPAAPARARDHRVAGRDRRATTSATPTRCRRTWPRRRPASSPPGSAARCGGTGTAAATSSTSCWPAARRARPGGSRPAP